MPKPTIRWTDKEVQFVIDEVRKGDQPPRAIAKRLGRSKMAIYGKMRELGLRHIPKPKVWTPERCALLTEMWERGDSLNVISSLLGCKPSTIVSKVYELGMPGRPMMQSKAAVDLPVTDKWPDLPADAFKDVKVGRDVQFRQNRPQDRTLAGVSGALV